MVIFANLFHVLSWYHLLRHFFFSQRIWVVKCLGGRMSEWKNVVCGKYLGGKIYDMAKVWLTQFLFLLGGTITGLHNIWVAKCLGVKMSE